MSLILCSFIAGSLAHLGQPECPPPPALRLTESVLERWDIECKDLGTRSHSPPKLAHTLWAQVEPRLVAPTLRGAVDPAEVCAAVGEAARAEDDYVRLAATLATRVMLPTAKRDYAGPDPDAVGAD